MKKDKNARHCVFIKTGLGKRGAGGKSALPYFDWYTQEGIERIMPHLQYYAERLGIPQPQLRIRELNYRWGPCSRKTNTVNLNWKNFYGITHGNFLCPGSRISPFP